MAKFTAPAQKRKPSIPVTKPRHGVLSARKGGDAHPVTEHKGGGYRMTGQSGAKRSPLGC
jgi:hypothetical protein